MKPLKYTVAALALIALASFTTAANAQTASTGDVILGLYDSSNSVTTSYELDLGAFNTLTAGESFNLGTTASSLFSSVPAGDLTFDIFAGGNSISGTAGGLAAKEIAFTALSVPTLSASNSTQYGDAATVYSTYSSTGATAVTLPSSTSSTNTAISAVTVPNTTTGSVYQEKNMFILGNNQSVATTFADGTNFTFYTKTGTGTGDTTANAYGTFVFSQVGGNDILTFDPVLSTPEPSAYALGLCALALFWVLKRRGSVA